MSRASLLDADLILFDPALRPYTYGASVLLEQRGALSSADSERISQAIAHWRTELRDCLNAGKTVFLILRNLEEIRLSSGETSLFGAEQEVTNYDVVPKPLRLRTSMGDSMILNPNQRLLRDYWQKFGSESEYQVYLTTEGSWTPLVTTRTGGRVVGAMSRFDGGGTLVALPWIEFEKDEFLSEVCQGEDEDSEFHWTSEAKKWGSVFVDTLIALDDAVRSGGERTPVPQWVQADSFKTNEEVALTGELTRLGAELGELRAKMGETEESLEEAGSLKALLFEQGEALEMAVLEAMRLIGFEANRYQDSVSEFDGVLECPEGRCIGEVEGRDRRAINIDKMRQLEGNILEDLDRDEVSEPAKAVLFGNAHRLTPPAERPCDHFTQKCIKAAERNGTALVRTIDLFTVAKALVNRSDADFASACRNAILNTHGQVVEFPDPPEAEY